MSKLDFINQKSLDPDLAVLNSLPFLEHQAWSDFLGKMKQEPRTSDILRREVLPEQSGCGIWLTSHFHCEGSSGWCCARTFKERL